MSSRTEVPGLCAGSLPSTRSSQETRTHPSSHRGRRGSRSPGVEVGRAGAAWALGSGRWHCCGEPDGSGEQEGQARDLGPRWVERP